MPQFVFEAHSTDYQPPEALAALVRDGFAILKVGPGLTFALREALYALDHIAAALEGRPGPGGAPGSHGSPDGREARAVAEVLSWDAAELRLQRHFSYSDRIRYYWPDPAAAAAVVVSKSALPDGRSRDPDQPAPRGALSAVAAGRISAEPTPC